MMISLYLNLDKSCFFW